MDNIPNCHKTVYKLGQVFGSGCKFPGAYSYEDGHHYCKRHHPEMKKRTAEAKAQKESLDRAMGRLKREEIEKEKRDYLTNLALSCGLVVEFTDSFTGTNKLYRGEEELISSHRKSDITLFLNGYLSCKNNS